MLKKYQMTRIRFKLHLRVVIPDILSACSSVRLGIVEDSRAYVPLSTSVLVIGGGGGRPELAPLVNRVLVVLKCLEKLFFVTSSHNWMYFSKVSAGLLSTPTVPFSNNVFRCFFIGELFLHLFVGLIVQNWFCEVCDLSIFRSHNLNVNYFTSY